MWYLSRIPITDSNSQPNNNNLYNSTFQNSIFPLSDTGLFEEISIVDVPNKPQINNNGDINDDDDDHDHNHTNSTATNNSAWEWFAYCSSLTKFHAVAVPRSPSFIALQLLAVLPERFLCAKLDSSVNPHPVLCIYSRVSNSWKDVPKMQCEDRNPIGAAGAVLNGWLYLAGGYLGDHPCIEPSNHLNSVERLNLNTLQWQPLSPMQKTRTFATGLAHRGKFYVVGGQTCPTLDRSTEIYNPTSNTWQLLSSFVPKEAHGFAVTSIGGRLMMLLTWSDQLGVKLWLLRETVNNPVNDTSRWRLLGFLPNSAVERVRFRQHGARLVQVGKEVWVLVGESDPICKVDGRCGWPVFPAPGFLPDRGRELEFRGYINAFSFFVGGRVRWRQIPVYKS